MSSLFGGSLLGHSPMEVSDKRPLGRIWILQFLFAALFILYAARLFNMQIVSGDIYRRRSLDIARRTIVLPAQRGEIYDRNFTEPLVVNNDTFAVTLTPAEVPEGDIPGLLTRVEGLLNLPSQELVNKIPPQYYQLYQPVEIASNVSFDAVAVLAENADTLPGLSWQPKPIRNYGEIGSLSHIIGYVGNITRDELIQLYNQGYQQGDVIGKMGLERQYDSILRGKDGLETRTVDVKGRRISGDPNNSRRAPAMGKNLVLTIDRSIQVLAEKALGKRMGAVVAMRPNGEILAMVSYPWYDPNLFNRRDMSREYFRISTDPNTPFINRAIQSSYPPASTFKILMSTALVAENLINPETRINCSGSMEYGNRTWHCWALGGHGWQNLQQGLANSCDIYFWITGRDNVGVDRISRYAKAFGYGRLTGIDLPGEAEGFIPTPQWKERIFHERWVAGDTMNMSIGQSYNLVTPLQLTNLVATVINDGVGYKPHVLKEIRDPVSRAIERTVIPEILHDMRNETPPKVFETVRNNMRTVVTQGSARVDNIRSVELAGKTGTAEVGLPDRWHCWFTAYGPYNAASRDEQVIVTVLVEASNPWDWWSPYATAIIFQGIFAGQTYEEAVAALGFQWLVPAQGRRE
ncbi:MAG: penicillin-binding protein 2 [Treponema sp.]|jgi:penicillin-binding protein 2|nr:penicillin-binding protein 2 [Treponema sp.]